MCITFSGTEQKLCPKILRKCLHMHIPRESHKLMIDWGKVQYIEFHFYLTKKIQTRVQDRHETSFWEKSLKTWICWNEEISRNSSTYRKYIYHTILNMQKCNNLGVFYGKNLLASKIYRKYTVFRKCKNHQAQGKISEIKEISEKSHAWQEVRHTIDYPLNTIIHHLPSMLPTPEAETLQTQHLRRASKSTSACNKQTKML